ncbi:DUF488 domain-containing protein [Sulfolobus sp. S-194]|uniref:DUF488 domain-containing protein n=1 Tax=Sulfolobus sp. S-194 TaxID=2512240 RepID=UPI00143734F0|nr:DUF488 domain-containing protein [Sulfolobus sp. S-194]QIW23609.1 DUF488 domain-containing protein [Sulfolobus sp. S-194]
MKIYTIGHSNRSIGEFLEILKVFKIQVLVDIRRWPKSRKYPHFNYESLRDTLLGYGIEYVWEKRLGGYRKFGKDVKDEGLGKCFKSEGFRAYSTYILRSKEAKEALEIIDEMAKKKTVVIMCAEILPWNCHRKIVSDWFMVKGYEVIHIINLNNTIKHKLTACADISNGNLTYK